MAGMVVQHNMNALNAYNRLNTNVNGLKKSSEKLSSGYRINRAGDDAAGLAISEKMRSQIRGLNQAKRNSQDGISMIQTFEGALQETHSILQRMKELATESANGTYDNATDRAAIQLEFDQLNDELNQIADTDFNGVVVLNGGEMADGLEKVVDENGDMVFDYANKKDQVTTKVTQMLDDKIAAAQKELDDANAAIESTKYDLSENGEAYEWNTVDNNNYDKAKADAVWAALGLTKDGSTTASATNPVVTDKINSVDVTFTYDGAAWTATSAIGNDGTKLDESKFTTTAATVADATGNGGFAVNAGGNNGIANAIFKAVDAKEGDTVTLTFTNAQPETYAPTNVGFAQDSVKVDIAANNGAGADVDLATAPTVGLALTDANMSQEAEDIFNALDGAEIVFTHDNTATTAKGVSINGVTMTTDGTYTLKDAEGNDIEDADGNAVQVTTAFANGELTIKDAAGNTLLTVNGGEVATATDAGTVSAKIAIEQSSFEEDSAVTVKPGDDKNLGTSNEASEARDAAAAKLAELTAQKDEVLSSWDNIKEYFGTADGVSISDAYDNSTAILTYKEDITLQVGSRSKDAVDFTFNYNKADMGDLEANLNVSAREGGLETANLSLSNQEDANYAIDQIDKAINKVSMVRATFGAMQNRLEHKIENITATSENLTEAESAIRDTDMASEMMSYTKFNILQQAAQSMLAQANQQPQGILQLLG